ncbi:MAG: trypsin-like serine protease [Acidobacteria bacterium]|nr:trypsin-like serine protease [Acidobacteriota bacterium]
MTPFQKLKLWMLAGFMLLSASRTLAQSLREVFKRVNPSVVVVHTHEDTITKAALSNTAPNAVAEAPFRQGVGSGVLIAADGKVLTAAHVINTADHIEVEFLNGERIAATVISAAPAADFALLQLARIPDAAVVARLGDSNLLEPGDQIFAVGAPYGAGHSLASGWISARRAAENITENLAPLETWQVDVALFQGNSGGPLFNLSGEVIGIVTHLLVKENQSTGPGFAVTSNTVRKLMLEEKQLWLGFEAWLIEDTLAEAFNLPQRAGLMVQSVVTNSLGQRMGLREAKIPIVIEGQSLLIGGDVLLEISGVPVRPAYASVREIQQRMQALRSGDALNAKVWRGGQVLELATTIP